MSIERYQNLGDGRPNAQHLHHPSAAEGLVGLFTNPPVAPGPGQSVGT